MKCFDGQIRKRHLSNAVGRLRIRNPHNGSFQVDFLLRSDRRDVFRFAAGQTESGAAFLRQASLPEGGVGSIILVERVAVLQRSSAVLRILELLGLPFCLATVFRIIPTAPRDHVYEWFARTRLKWFGRLQACR